MAEDRTRAVERLCKGQGGELDFLRETVRRSVHWLMEEEMGAGRWERTEERTTYRNGLRHAQRSTLVAALDRAVPKLRSGSCFPGWLEPTRR